MFMKAITEFPLEHVHKQLKDGSKIHKTPTQINILPKALIKYATNQHFEISSYDILLGQLKDI